MATDLPRPQIWVAAVIDELRAAAADSTVYHPALVQMK
jgi:hypothetical protein